MLEKEYKAWLEREGYQPTTIASSVASTRAAERKWSEASQEALGDLVKHALTPYGPLLKRYSRFLHSIPFPRWSAWEKFVVDNFEAAKVQLQKGATVKPPLTARQWRALVSLLQQKEEKEDEVLSLVIALLPEMEPRAILAMQLKDFKHTYEETLRPMREKRVRFLWSYISPTPAGAFKRIARQLKKRTEQLGFAADFFSLSKTPEVVRQTARAA